VAERGFQELGFSKFPSPISLSANRRFMIFQERYNKRPKPDLNETRHLPAVFDL